MHEASLARQLIAVAGKHCVPPGGATARVTRLVVRIGALAGVSPSALSFAFATFVPGTCLADARLEFETVPLTLDCDACGERSPVADLVFRCPRCNDPRTRIATGRELQLGRVEFSEEGIDREHC